MTTFLSFNSLAQSKKQVNQDTESWKYEIEAIKTGTQGSYLIKVWSYSKSPQLAIEQAKKKCGSWNNISGIHWQARCFRTETTD